MQFSIKLLLDSFFYKLIEVHDTFELMRGIIDFLKEPWASRNEPINGHDQIDCIIAIKLKEYLIVQLRALLLDQDRNHNTISLNTIYNYLKKRGNEESYKSILLFKEENKVILEKINILRNKKFAHYENVDDKITIEKLEKSSINLSTEDLELLIFNCECLLKCLNNLNQNEGCPASVCLGPTMPEAVSEWVNYRKELIKNLDKSIK